MSSFGPTCRAIPILRGLYSLLHRLGLEPPRSRQGRLVPEDLRDRLDRPVSGVLYDVAHNAFWDSSWGPRPASTDEAETTARAQLRQVPMMVPVYSHRYLPAGRGSHGHPVLSMYQTDIIVYGTDLANYIDHEFVRSGWSISADWTPPAMVPFWSEFLSLDGCPAKW